MMLSVKIGKRCIKNKFYYSTNTKSTTKNASYSNTVLLPQTKLPLRLENRKLIERDVTINNLEEFKQLYSWQRKNLKSPEFILHDGPPYANGVPHMGHAINKILKDTILRYKIIQGQKVHYVPGWDCHGLPIELKAISKNKSNLSNIEIREKARNFARDAITKQMESFKSWGVMGDWSSPYTTFSPAYVKNQIRQFLELYEKNLIFRDVKPVYWSPSSRTALAEAELEYNPNHKSTAVFLKLKLNNLPESIYTEKTTNVYALLWTTTPWTLPSNQAVCFNPNLSYSIVEFSEMQSDYYIVATNLVDSLSKVLRTTSRIINNFDGNLLSSVKYRHPFSSKVLPFLAAEHVTETKGTGLVHTAPAHGPDDFLVALKNKLPIISLVNEEGCYTSDAGPDLKDLFVLSQGTEAVLNILKNDILHTETHTHSYPYDWRTKKPIIIRASKQWFIDTDTIKNKAMEVLANVKILPKAQSDVSRKNMEAQLQKRPYWCISRQRIWGVPIPVFYKTSNEEPIISRDLIDHLCNQVDKHGTDFWWKLPPNELLTENLLKNFNTSLSNITKGKDILDIWFDSGLSWYNVLGPDRIADLYLEGVDQFTGWFQSSLMTSVALRNKSPYKSLYVHGFAVDEEGMKMSKSLGNVTDPLDVVQGKKGHKAYGIDTLRWWVVCHASSDSMAHVSTNVLKASADEVQKIRSVLRFAIGALFDYKEETLNYNRLPIMDKYLLHAIWGYHNRATEMFENYDFSKLSAFVINFITNLVSSLYYVAIKDRLYCNLPDNEERRAAQFVLLQVVKIVSGSIAPVIPHLAEEVHLHLPQRNEGSFFQTPVTVRNEWNNPKLAEIIENVILKIKKDIHAEYGANTFNVDVTVSVSASLSKNLQEILHNDLETVSGELVDVFQVSKVQLVEDESRKGDEYLISMKESDFHMCDRCRRVFSENENELCSRCKDIVSNLGHKHVVAN